MTVSCRTLKSQNQKRLPTVTVKENQPIVIADKALTTDDIKSTRSLLKPEGDNMSKSMRNFFLPALAVSFLCFSIYHLLYASEKLPKETPLVDPPRQAFAVGISGTGLVEAKTENISIGTAVAGVVLEVCVSNDQLGKRVVAG